jgi:DNA-binding XRE family transcriptional regulator
MVNPAKDAVWPRPSLIRAARALAGIDQSALALAAGVSRKAVVTLENDSGIEMDYRRLEVLRKVQAALEKEFGIEFIARDRAGMGVRFRSPDR